MKTIRIVRTVRRLLPDGEWLVWIGPGGLKFRHKHAKDEFLIPWKEALDRAMKLRADELLRQNLPLVGNGPSGCVDARQADLLPDMGRSSKEAFLDRTYGSNEAAAMAEDANFVKTFEKTYGKQAEPCPMCGATGEFHADPWCHHDGRKCK